jgi:23S rRNA (uracil1939-C5)-methyltransferase
MSQPVSQYVVVDVDALVAGGDGLAREASGRVVFVPGALPGERVRVRIVEEHTDFARGSLDAVVSAAPGRIAAPCPHVARGCGGCDLQHATVATQRAAKAEVVLDSLRRHAGIAFALDRFEPGPVLPSGGFRTTVRAAVRRGRLGFRASRSHDVVAVDSCLVAHPLVEEVLIDGEFPGATEVTIRAGAATGERLVIVEPQAGAARVPPGVRVVGGDELRRGRRAFFYEEIDGVRFRISARSFFQSRPDGAAALVTAVTELGGAELAAARHVVDAYGGVGLFSRFLARSWPTQQLTLVERSRSSVADARSNLDGSMARVVACAVEQWRPEPADVVIADPARGGVGKAATERLAATAAAVIVLVSCDAAAFGRDARLLQEAGYELERVRLVDLFPHTHHVEVVSRFARITP